MHLTSWINDDLCYCNCNVFLVFLFASFYGQNDGMFIREIPYLQAVITTSATTRKWNKILFWMFISFNFNLWIWYLNIWHWLPQLWCVNMQCVWIKKSIYFSFVSCYYFRDIMLSGLKCFSMQVNCRASGQRVGKTKPIFTVLFYSNDAVMCVKLWNSLSFRSKSRTYVLPTTGNVIHELLCIIFILYSTVFVLFLSPYLYFSLFFKPSSCLLRLWIKPLCKAYAVQTEISGC